MQLCKLTGQPLMKSFRRNFIMTAYAHMRNFTLPDEFVGCVAADAHDAHDIFYFIYVGCHVHTSFHKCAHIFSPRQWQRACSVASISPSLNCPTKYSSRWRSITRTCSVSNMERSCSAPFLGYAALLVDAGDGFAFRHLVCSFPLNLLK